MEKWDAYTRNGIKTGDVLIRGMEIPDGLYHIVCETIVFHRDGTILCMKRAAEKATYAGMLEATAGGSALLGERPIDCIKRELFEETGINSEKFLQLGYHIYDRDKCIFYSFICTVDCNKDNVVLQRGETDGFVWMSIDEYLTSPDIIESQRKRFVEYLDIK